MDLAESYAIIFFIISQSEECVLRAILELGTHTHANLVRAYQCARTVRTMGRICPGMAGEPWTPFAYGSLSLDVHSAGGRASQTLLPARLAINQALSIYQSISIQGVQSISIRIAAINQYCKCYGT